MFRSAVRSTCSRRVPFHPRGGDFDETWRAEFCDNVVVTSKYTLLTFLPKNLFEQFRRIANFYFLVMMILSWIPGLSPFTPITSVLPLLFVVFVTAVKQAYEDYQRHKADAEINLTVTHVLFEGGYVQDVDNQDVVIGDLVKVMDGEQFPCDLVLLRSSLPTKDAYITTANLDGETSLKIRNCAPLTADLSVAALAGLEAHVECDAPQPSLYKFSGMLTLWNGDHAQGQQQPTQPFPRTSQNPLISEVDDLSTEGPGRVTEHHTDGSPKKIFHRSLSSAMAVGGNSLTYGVCTLMCARV
jgi:magnesium-transporting ATPase (P-type)